MSPGEDHRPTRVVIADDHDLFREGVREILEAQRDVEVVGEAGDGAAAVVLAESMQPDVVLLDVEMPGPPVTRTVERLNAVAPASRVVILSMSDEPQLIRQLIGLDIYGYLLKSVSRQELVALVRGAPASGARVTVSVSRESLQRLGDDDPGADGARRAGLLNERETDVLQLAAQALSNAQIATRLETTEATVKRHLRNVFAKLGAVSRIDAVNRAVAAGLISPAAPPALSPDRRPGG